MTKKRFLIYMLIFIPMNVFFAFAGWLLIFIIGFGGMGEYGFMDHVINAGLGLIAASIIVTANFFLIRFLLPSWRKKSQFLLTVSLLVGITVAIPAGIELYSELEEKYHYLTRDWETAVGEMRKQTDSLHSDFELNDIESDLSTGRNKIPWIEMEKRGSFTTKDVRQIKSWYETFGTKPFGLTLGNKKDWKDEITVIWDKNGALEECIPFDHAICKDLGAPKWTPIIGEVKDQSFETYGHHTREEVSFDAQKTEENWEKQTIFYFKKDGEIKENDMYSVAYVLEGVWGQKEHSEKQWMFVRIEEEQNPDNFLIFRLDIEVDKGWADGDVTLIQSSKNVETK